MLKSPNNVQIEANQGRGDIIVRGYMKAERARVENLSAPILESMQRQLEELRLQIAAGSLSSLSSSAPVPVPVPVPAPAPTPVPVQPASPPAATTSQIFKLQEQIATLNARLNTMQDRIQALETRLASSASAGAGGGGIVSDVASSLAAGVVAEVSHVATEQIHKAAMKLEDMVSPGALYNLRKVSRENVKFAW